MNASALSLAVGSAFAVGSVKERVLMAVHKLGRSASVSMIYRTRISTDSTVDVAIKALVRDGYLTINAADICELTEVGFAAIEVDPGTASPTAAAPKAVAEALPAREPLKRCGACKHPKPLDKFDRANRSPDGRTSDCSECRRPAVEVKTPAEHDPVDEPVAPVAHETSTAPAPLVLLIPTIEGVYARVEGERVYLSQQRGNDHLEMHLNRERGLALGRFLCEHLG